MSDTAHQEARTWIDDEGSVYTYQDGDIYYEPSAPAMEARTRENRERHWGAPLYTGPGAPPPVPDSFWGWR